MIYKEFTMGLLPTMGLSGTWSVSIAGAKQPSEMHSKVNQAKGTVYHTLHDSNMQPGVKPTPRCACLVMI